MNGACARIALRTHTNRDLIDFTILTFVTSLGCVPLGAGPLAGSPGTCVLNAAKDGPLAELSTGKGIVFLTFLGAVARPAGKALLIVLASSGTRLSVLGT